MLKQQYRQHCTRPRREWKAETKFLQWHLMGLPMQCWISWKTLPSPISSHTAYRVGGSNSVLGIPWNRRCTVLDGGPSNYIRFAIWPNENFVLSHTSHLLKLSTVSTWRKIQVRDNLKTFRESLHKGDCGWVWLTSFVQTCRSQNHRMLCVGIAPQGSSSPLCKWIVHMGINSTTLALLTPCSICRSSESGER